MKVLLKVAKIAMHPSEYRRKYDKWATDANSKEHLDHINSTLESHAKKKGKSLSDLQGDEFQKAYHSAMHSPKMKALHKKHFGH